MYKIIVFLILTMLTYQIDLLAIDENNKEKIVDWGLWVDGEYIKLKAMQEYNYDYEDRNKAPIINKDYNCAIQNIKNGNTIECLLTYATQIYSDREDYKEILQHGNIKKYNAVKSFRIVGKYRYEYKGKQYIELQLFNEQVSKWDVYITVLEHIKDNKYKLIKPIFEACYPDCET